MFSTKFGQRNLIRRYVANELATSVLAAPTVGQAVVLGTSTAVAALRPTATKRNKAASLTFAVGDIGKLNLATAAPTGNGELDGIIVRVNMNGSVVGSVDVAPPGEFIPLWMLGSPGLLRSFGNLNILYLSEDAAGAVKGTVPASGYIRKVARLPKVFVQLTDADLDQENPDALYVQLIEERPTLI